MFSYLLMVGGALGLLMATMPHLFVHESVLGIDLGTTFSVAAVCVGGHISVVEAGANRTVLTPSTVWFRERGEAVVGWEAHAQREHDPRNVVFDAKRLMGRKWGDEVVEEEKGFLPFDLVEHAARGMVGLDLPARKGSVVLPEEVGERVLRFLKREAEAWQGRVKQVLGFRFHTVTISVPVLFTPDQRRATEHAGRAAGFKMVRLVEEPVAAALAYGLASHGNKDVLVFDLGGGTLDVALLHLTPDTRGFLVRATAGDPHLGGEDFDRNIVPLLLPSPAPPASSFSPAYEQHLARTAESVKQQLQATDPTTGRRLDSVVVRVALPFHTTPGAYVDVTLTAEVVDAVNARLVERAMRPVFAVLEEVGMGLEGVSDVVLVGGSSRLVAIRDGLRAAFAGTSAAFHTEIDPDLAIAIGAARAFGCG